MLKLVFIFLASLFFHPVHVSVASLDYDEEKASFSLFLKLFSDDLEDDCRLMRNDPALQLYDADNRPSREIIEEYLETRLIFEAEEERLRAVVGEIDYDPQAEEVRLYVTYEYAGKGRRFRIVNKIMTDLFDDQANLLIFRMGNWEEGFKFTPQVTEIIINPGERSY